MSDKVKGSELLEKLRSILKENKSLLDKHKGEFKTNLRPEVNGVKHIVNSMFSVTGFTISEVEKSFEVQKNKIINLAILIKNNIVSVDSVSKDFGIDLDNLEFKEYYKDLILAYKILELSKSICMVEIDIKTTESKLLDESEKKAILTSEILSRYN